MRLYHVCPSRDTNFASDLFFFFSINTLHVTLFRFRESLHIVDRVSYCP